MPAHERASIASELDPPFTVLAPASQTAPVVLCSPHSGRVYPRRFLALSRLDPMTLRKSEDCYVDDLFEGVAGLGVPLVAARFPRAYLDVNREPYELDPELFAEPPPEYANTQSARVLGGLGTIARIVADGEDIYRARLPLEVGLERVDRLYFPFHAALGELIEATRRRFGLAILVDCHSMPSVSMGLASGLRPDFVLGDRFGAACDGRLTGCLRDGLRALGYDVQLNRPYAGGYITEHYGLPAGGLHALQIEVNRGLYVDEMTLALNSGYPTLQRNLTAVFRHAFAELPDLLRRRAAAE